MLGPEIPVDQPGASPSETSPAAAFNGSTYFVVWRPGSGALRGTRMDATGVVLDQSPISVGSNYPATVGSTAPFVGLFGTVWGIMRSFTGIAQAQNTSLAVVAPGIAEALFATAIGLFAAIPAVIAYNRFSHGINRIEARLNRFADGFHATLSRQLESEVRR